MSFFILIVISISLSMDAFSLSLAYGTINLNKRNNLLLSIIVGLYHFIMPLLGKNFGNFILKYITIETNIIVFLVLNIIGIQMIIESFKEKTKGKQLNLIEMLLFGFTVSIDSFSLGIGLKEFKLNCLLSSFIFAISSFIFTYLGLILGKRIENRIGKISTLIGGLILIIIGFFYK